MIYSNIVYLSPVQYDPITISHPPIHKSTGHSSKLFLRSRLAVSKLDTKNCSPPDLDQKTQGWKKSNGLERAMPPMPYGFWGRKNILMLNSKLQKLGHPIFIYLEPKWGPLFWLEKGLVFTGRLTFKNRGHWGSRYLYTLYHPWKPGKLPNIPWKIDGWFRNIRLKWSLFRGTFVNARRVGISLVFDFRSKNGAWICNIILNKNV